MAATPYGLLPFTKSPEVHFEKPPLDTPLLKLTFRVREKVTTFLASNPHFPPKEALAIIDILASMREIHLGALELFLADRADFKWDKESEASLYFLEMVITYVGSLHDDEERDTIELIKDRGMIAPCDLLITAYEMLSILLHAPHTLSLYEKLIHICEILLPEIDDSFLIVPPSTLPPSTVLSVTPLDSGTPVPWIPFGLERVDPMVELSHHKELMGTRNGECIAYHLRVLASFIAMMDTDRTDITPFILPSIFSLLRHLFLMKMDLYDPSLNLAYLAEKSSITLTDDENTLITYFEDSGFYTCQPHQKTGNDEMKPFFRKTIECRWSKTAHITNIGLTLALLTRVLNTSPIVIEPYHDEIPDRTPRPIKLIDIGQKRYPQLVPLSHDLSSLVDYLLRLNFEIFECDLFTLPALAYSTQLVLYQLINGLNRAALAKANEGVLPPTGVHLALCLPTYPKWSPLIQYIALLNHDEVFDPNLEMYGKFYLVECVEVDAPPEHPEVTKIIKYQNLKLVADIGIRYTAQLECKEEYLCQGRVVSKKILMEARDTLRDAVKEVLEYVHTLKILEPTAVKV